MKKKFLRLITLSLLTVSIGLLFGCKNANEENSEDINTKTELEGTIDIVGSTALQPLAEKVAENFMLENAGVSITVQGGGSGTGVNQVASGNSDIGNSDFPSKEKLEDESLTNEMKDNKVCIQPFSIIVNKENSVQELTKEDISKIFSGEITSWKELGGEDMDIEVLNRPESSGTRAAFNSTLMNGKEIKDDIGTIQDSSGAIMQAVEGSKSSIAYVGTAYTKNTDKVAGVKIDGYTATKEAIENENYPFWAYGYMITKGNSSEVVTSFIEYLKVDTKTIEDLGYYPVK